MFDVDYFTAKVFLDIASIFTSKISFGDVAVGLMSSGEVQGVAKHNH